MKLIKEECENALARIMKAYSENKRVYDVYHELNPEYSLEEDALLLSTLINDLLGNSPLMENEIEPGMMVYDKKSKAWIKLFSVCGRMYYEIVNYQFFTLTDCHVFTFEEKRYFRKEVEEADNEEKNNFEDGQEWKEYMLNKINDEYKRK